MNTGETPGSAQLDTDMKSFLQYLLEMPVMRNRESPKSLQLTVDTKPPSIPSKLLGKIGPYQIHHHDDADEPAISVRHKGKQVGILPIVRVGKEITFDIPTMSRKHSGKRALVKDLVPKIYAMVADNIAPIVSSETQSTGGRSVWARLSKMRQVTASASPYARSSISTPVSPNLPKIDNYSPEKHDKTVYATRDYVLKVGSNKKRIR